jgi:hypothetical protein
MAEGTECYTGRITPFDGKKKEWVTFEEKLCVRAKHEGSLEVLMGRTPIPPDDQVLDPVADLRLIEAKAKNEFAYSELIEAMDTTKSGGQIAFDIIKRSKTAEHLYGNCEVAWRGLRRKYTPKTGPSLAKINKLFYSSKLKKKMDPNEFIFPRCKGPDGQNGIRNDRRAIYDSCLK